MVVNLEQPKNIALMFATLAVLKLLKSRIVRLAQLLNMELMFVTFAVLKPLKLRLVC